MLLLVGSIVSAAALVAAALLVPVVNRRVGRSDLARRAIADELEILTKMPDTMRDGPEGQALDARVRAQITALGDTAPQVAPLVINGLPTNARAASRAAAFYLGLGGLGTATFALGGEFEMVAAGMIGCVLLVGFALAGAAMGLRTRDRNARG